MQQNGTSGSARKDMMHHLRPLFDHWLNTLPLVEGLDVPQPFRVAQSRWSGSGMNGTNNFFTRWAPLDPFQNVIRCEFVHRYTSGFLEEARLLQTSVATFMDEQQSGTYPAIMLSIYA